MCHINYYICSRCYHGYARFTNVCPDMHPPLKFCPKGTPFRLRIVEETACYLHPYHAAPMHEGYMPYGTDSCSVSHTSQQGDQSVTAEGRRFVGQYPNQRTDPPNDKPTVYGFGSESYAFYPWHYSPLYPFYYPVSGKTELHGPFQTPPPLPKSQLTSPESHHTKESNQQTPFNPHAQVFQPEMEHTILQAERGQDIHESTGISNKEVLYNCRRGISRSLCNDEEYQSNLDTHTELTSAYEDTPLANLTLHAGDGSPGLSVSSQLDILSESPRDFEQAESFTTSSIPAPAILSQEISLQEEQPGSHDPSYEHDKSKADLKAITKGVVLDSELLADDNRFEINNQIEFAGQCKDMFLEKGSKSVYHKPWDFTRNVDFSARRKNTVQPPRRGPWKHEANAAFPGEGCTIKAVSDSSDLSDVAITVESDDRRIYPATIGLHHGDVKHGNIPHEHNHSNHKIRYERPRARSPLYGGMPSIRGTPQSANIESIEIKKLFDNADFPTLASSNIAGDENNNHAPESRPMSTANSTPESAAADTPDSTSASSAPNSNNPWTRGSADSQSPTPVPWSKIVSGQHAKAPAATLSPAPSPSNQPDAAETMTIPPRAAIADASKEGDAATRASKPDFEKQPAGRRTPAASQPEPVPRKPPSTSSATATATATTPSVPERLPAGPDRVPSPTPRRGEDDDAARGSIPISDTPAPRPRLWSQLVGGGGSGGPGPGSGKKHAGGNEAWPSLGASSGGGGKSKRNAS